MRTHGQLGALVQSRVRQMVLSGALKPGQRVKENQLADKLKVSRTPLRQGLLALVTEGLVIAEPNVGFSIAPLSVEEVRALYPVVWTLEALALEDGFDLLRAQTGYLKEANDLFSRSGKDALQATRADQEFHRRLASFSPNEHLKSLLEEEKRKLLRYEHFYMSGTGHVKRSTQDHAAIITAVTDGNLQEARHALVENWKLGMWKILSNIELMTRP